MKVTFAHGLWSSTESSKAAWMRAQGWDVTTLDMRKYGWDQACQTRVVVEAIDDMGPFDVLIGSSFGGLATANAAAQRPEADLRLVLLAPAFGYDELVASTLGQEAMEAWEDAGTHTFHPPGWDEPVVMPWSFVEVARTHSWPTLQHPTAILHGAGDDVVPLANSELAKGDLGHVTLHVVDDGHRLHESLGELISLTRQVLDA
ncbi:MAG: alpha/beta hydrolase [Poseidonia sp.]